MQIAEVELLAVSDTVPCDIADFVTPPVDTPVLEGASATFFAEVNGPWPVQWLRNGEIIPGATSLTFTTDAVTAENAGDEYAVEILGCAISLPVQAVLFTPSDTTSFGFSLVGGGANGAPTALDPNDIAGVHQQANWNNVDDGATTNIVDSNGNASDISVTFPTTGEWGAGTGTDDANARLLNGLVQVGTGGTGSVAFNNIPAGNHAVIAYTVSRPLEFVNVDFAITGTDKVAYVRSMNSDEYNPAPGFFRGTSTNPGVRTIANYVRFDNITTEQFGNIELTWTGAGGGQAVINGVQLLLNAPDPGTPPEIIVGPQPLGALEGQPILLDVEATGDDLVYQWRKDGKNLFDTPNVLGVNTRNLWIESFTEENEGAYSVAVFNPAGSLISSPAVVKLSNFDVNESLVTHYKMDGNGNNSGSDPYPLVPTGITFGDGQIGQAGEFDGFTSYGYAENISKARTGLSGSAWVRVDPNVINGFNVPMFIRNAEGGALNINETFEFGLFYNDINFTMHLGASIAVGPNISNAQDGMEFPLGEWQHIAFSADGATLRVYRNGQLVAQTNYIDDINSPTVPWISVGARLTDDGFGSLFPDASLPDFMEGSMDDVAIWTRGLTAAEVDSIYTQGQNGLDVSTATVTYTQPERPSDLPVVGETDGQGDNLGISIDGTSVTISWEDGTLQESDSVTGPYNDTADQTNPQTREASGTRFFRTVE